MCSNKTLCIKTGQIWLVVFSLLTPAVERQYAEMAFIQKLRLSHCSAFFGVLINTMLQIYICMCMCKPGGVHQKTARYPTTLTMRRHTGPASNSHTTTCRLRVSSLAARATRPCVGSRAGMLGNYYDPALLRVLSQWLTGAGGSGSQLPHPMEGRSQQGV